MIGSGAPALRAIAHLLSNQIIQYHVTVFRRVYLYGFQTDKVARSLIHLCTTYMPIQAIVS